MVLFKVAIGQMGSGAGIKCFIEFPGDSLFIKFDEFERKEMSCIFFWQLRSTGGLKTMAESMRKNFLLGSRVKKVSCI